MILRTNPEYVDAISIGACWVPFQVRRMVGTRCSRHDNLLRMLCSGIVSQEHQPEFSSRKMAVVRGISGRTTKPGGKSTIILLIVNLT